jgi:hypothetical protein
MVLYEQQFHGSPSAVEVLKPDGPTRNFDSVCSSTPADSNNFRHDPGPFGLFPQESVEPGALNPRENRADLLRSIALGFETSDCDLPDLRKIPHFVGPESAVVVLRHMTEVFNREVVGGSVLPYVLGYRRLVAEISSSYTGTEPVQSVCRITRGGFRLSIANQRLP